MKHCLEIIKTDSEISQANTSSINFTVNKNRENIPILKPGIFNSVNDQSKIWKGTYEIQEILYHFKISQILLLYVLPFTLT